MEHFMQIIEWMEIYLRPFVASVAAFGNACFTGRTYGDLYATHAGDVDLSD
jgi:hypothetical protein